MADATSSRLSAHRNGTTGEIASRKDENNSARDSTRADFRRQAPQPPRLTISCIFRDFVLLDARILLTAASGRLRAGFVLSGTWFPPSPSK
jgi:hypothetical protein